MPPPVPPAEGPPITRLLGALSEGDERALNELMPLVYGELRRIARSQRARLRPGETLDTTALVHEAYLKLAGHDGLSVRDRHHFYSLAARVMRQLIVDYARARSAQKRGGAMPEVTLERLELGDGSPADQAEMVLAIDGALQRLDQFDARLARVFECRFFLGLTAPEASQVLDMPLRSVQRSWMKSKAWLRAELA